jgi:hypothetical protein
MSKLVSVEIKDHVDLFLYLDPKVVSGRTVEDSVYLGSFKSWGEINIFSEKYEKKVPVKVPVSEYKCQKCDFLFQRDSSGQVVCPKCESNYVDWTNYKEVLNWLYRHDPDFKNYRKVEEKA